MIYVVGHLVYDHIFKVDSLPEPNSARPIREYKEFFGGGAGNFVMVCSKLNQKSSLISLVGEDFRNSNYEKNLKLNGVGLRYLKYIKGEKTARAFIANDCKKRQISLFYWGAARFFNKLAVPKLEFKEGDLLHISSGHPNFNARIAGTYPGISFDVGQDVIIYNKKNLDDIFHNTRFLFCNEFELKKILEKTSLRDASKLFGYGIEYVVVSKGKKGSIILTKKDKIRIPALRVKVVDPTGAGDAHRAAFLTSFLRGNSLEMCGKVAASVASFIVEKDGAQTNIPTWDMAVAKLKKAKFA